MRIETRREDDQALIDAAVAALRLVSPILEDFGDKLVHFAKVSRALTDAERLAFHAFAMLAYAMHLEYLGDEDEGEIN
jgi:hypothetical protein